MTTLCRRAFVSIAATMTLTLSLAACVNTRSRPALDPISAWTRPVTIRFENMARDNVDVYLIGEKREWHLGRVATGAIASLRLPDEAVAEDTMIRLAVISGERLTFTAAKNPRAVLTIAQPAAAVLSQRWAFSQGYISSSPF